MKNKFTYLLIALVATLSYTSVQADPPEAPKGKRWVKVESMSDEFNGTSLDKTKWADSDPNWRGRKPGKFEPHTIKVKDGKLQITTSKKDKPSGGWTHNGAMVRSLMNQKLGYFETRMKSSKTFMSSTFWIMTYGQGHTGCDKGRYQELDITENVGINTGGKKWIDNMINNINSNSHPDKTPPCPTDEKIESRGNPAPLPHGPGYSRYYTIGCWWKSVDEFIIYLDGVEQYTINPSVDFTLPMYLRMVVETYDWNPPKKGEDGMDGSVEDRTTYYDWTRSWELVDAE